MTIDPSPTPGGNPRAPSNSRTMQRTLPRRLLGVWAHPDDEAYLSAGLMARVAAAGGSVTVVTATRGELGTDDPALRGSERFAAHRERELTASLAQLGVTDLRMLGIRDGDCDHVDGEKFVGEIGEVIDDVRPDAIVTFGPDGITFHPDHRAVSRWTTDAWLRSDVGDLLYAAMTDDFVDRRRTLHDQIGLFADLPGGQPISFERASISLECVLSDVELRYKRQALAEHASQTAGLAEAIGEATYHNWWGVESFRAPTPAEIAARRAEHAQTIAASMRSMEGPAGLRRRVRTDVDSGSRDRDEPQQVPRSGSRR